MARQCSKTGCSESAAATLTYQYGHAQVWLDPLHHERDPHAYDLCARHAGRMTTPQGWQLVDRRAPQRPSLLAGVQQEPLGPLSGTTRVEVDSLLEDVEA